MKAKLGQLVGAALDVMQVHLHLVALTHHSFLCGIDSHDQKYCKALLLRKKEANLASK